MKISEYARFKRCYELYSIDPEFRNMMENSPFLAVAMLGYGDMLDPQLALQAIHGILFRSVEWSVLRENPYYQIFSNKDNEVKELIMKVHEREAFCEEEIFYYMDTQRNRCRMESSAIKNNPLIFYYPFAIELSSGCSIQCPFCGFAPDKFSGYLPYNEENRQLFRDTLKYLKGRFGLISGLAPCYLATEPLDNPDYEKYVRDYFEITGCLPQTTTAAAEKYPERIKAMIAEYGYDLIKKFAALRFSVRNISQYKKIISLYQPEELLDIEVIANNPESVNRYSESGKVMKITNLDDIKKHKYSIDCVAGLRICMEKGVVEFIEPELPDEQFFKGYSVRERQRFDDYKSLEKVIDGMIEKYMKGRLPFDLPLEINRNVKVIARDGNFVFCGDETEYEVGISSVTENAVEMMKKTWTMRQMAELTSSEDEKKMLMNIMGSLFQRGYVRLHSDLEKY
ncbi:MAG: hypothetical protein ACI4LO_01530 [Anaerovoracaceae bacterium]